MNATQILLFIAAAGTAFEALRRWVYRPLRRVVVAVITWARDTTDLLSKVEANTARTADLAAQVLDHEQRLGTVETVVQLRKPTPWNGAERRQTGDHR